MTSDTVVYEGPGEVGVIDAAEFGEHVRTLAARFLAEPERAAVAVLDLNAATSPVLATLIARDAVHLWIDYLLDQDALLRLHAAADALPRVVMAYRIVRPSDEVHVPEDPAEGGFDAS